MIASARPRCSDRRTRQTSRTRWRLAGLKTFEWLGIAGLFLCIQSRPAMAAPPTEAEIRARIERVLNVHYASADLETAELELTRLIEECGQACSVAQRARAWMYIGIVRGSGRDDLVGAQKAFAEAKALDPKVELDELFATDLVKRVFERTNAAPSPAAPTAPIPPPRAAPPMAFGTSKSDGALECSLTAEEAPMGWSIPILCEYGGDAPVDSLVLHISHEREGRWRSVPLEPGDQGFSGQIACTETLRPGVLSYYIEAQQAGATMSALGSARKPRRLTLVAHSDVPALTLPGQPPPERCGGMGSAPEAPLQILGKLGEQCESSSTCVSGLHCRDGRCSGCEGDEDCGGERCLDGLCNAAGKSACIGVDCVTETPAHWLGVQAGADFGWMSGDGVCGIDAAARFSCFEGEDPYRGIPNRNYSGATNTHSPIASR
jgi:hypothetical protein